MWPWAEQPHIQTLLQQRKKGRGTPSSTTRSGGGGSVGGSSGDRGIAGRLRGVRPLPLLAPGGGRPSDDIRDGSYQLPANFVVDGDLLEAALEGVIWLVVVFEPRPRGAGNADADDAEEADPFPAWVLRLRNLRGLSLVRYPHPTLPEDIGDLTTLERLHCYRSNLRRVPRSIGRLKNLVELDMYTSYGLHYLPYEVTRCSRLAESRFSTRALYANYKNDLPLPPLPRSGWDRGEVRPSYSRGSNRAELRDLLLRPFDFGGFSSAKGAASTILLPAELVERHILPLLRWNRCSVCDGLYRDELGRPVWSHRVVATDAQSLLAFCCSAECEAAVPDRMAFDPVGGKNERVAIGGRRGREEELDDEEEKQAAWIVARDAARGIGVCVPEQYEEWVEEHLLPPTETERADAAKAASVIGDRGGTGPSPKATTRSSRRWWHPRKSGR